MKTLWVATSYARKSGTLFQQAKYFGTVLLISGLFLIISCDKSDDLNEPLINNELPVATNASHIIYTDIEPDFFSENGNDFYELDLNNDKIVDFTFRVNTDISVWLEIITNANGAIISVDPWYTNIVRLESDMEIFNLRGYKNGESYKSGGIIASEDCFGMEDSGVCAYDWSGENDKYLGLRFTIKGQIHYGWARLSVKSPTQWIVSDYAFNATPNSPILAGQKE